MHFVGVCMEIMVYFVVVGYHLGVGVDISRNYDSYRHKKAHKKRIYSELGRPEQLT